MGTHRYKYHWDFFEKDSEELYYFLGFIAADGYISDDSIEIALNVKDTHILESFRDLIVPDKPLQDKKHCNAKILKLGMKKIIPVFKEYFNMTTNKKHEEMSFPYVPKEYIRHFIRGYVDGDGNIDTTKSYKGSNVYVGPRLRILGNEKFLTVLNEATRDAISHKTNALSKKGKENVFYVTYNFSTAKGILKWLYDDAKIYLIRKSDKYKEVCYKDEDIV